MRIAEKIEFLLGNGCPKTSLSHPGKHQRNEPVPKLVVPGSISGHVNQFPLDQFVVFGSFGREQLKIVDREQGAG
jgi:hypothetical protein